MTDKLTSDDLERAGLGDTITVPVDFQVPDPFKGEIEHGSSIRHDGTNDLRWQSLGTDGHHLRWLYDYEVKRLEFPRSAASWIEDEPERVEVSRAAARRALELLRAAPDWSVEIKESDIDLMQRAIAEALEANKRDPKVVELENALEAYFRGDVNGADLAQHLADEGFQKVDA